MLLCLSVTEGNKYFSHCGAAMIWRECFCYENICGCLRQIRSVKHGGKKAKTQRCHTTRYTMSLSGYNYPSPRQTGATSVCRFAFVCVLFLRAAICCSARSRARSLQLFHSRRLAISRQTSWCGSRRSGTSKRAATGEALNKIPPTSASSGVVEDVALVGSMSACLSYRQRGGKKAFLWTI